MRQFFMICLVIVVGIKLNDVASAVDYFWTNINGGAYDEPSNWTPFSPPGTQGPGGSTDTVNFNLGALSAMPYFVTDMGRENGRLIVHNDSLLISVFVHHELSSAGGANPSFIVGASSGDDGFVSLFGGGVSTLDTQVVRIANAAGSEGSVRVDGLTWTNTNLRVGRAGDGILSTDSDAVINSTNASIAHLAGSTGRAVILGMWDVSDTLIVGRQGEGSLEVTSGGIVHSNASIVGDEATGNGDVFVNATWITDGSLTIGDSGRGQLLVTGSLGNVSSGDAYVGRSVGSRGTVVVGSGSWTVNGRLSIGGDADAATSGGDSIVEISNGPVSVAQDITIFSGGQISLVGGSLDAPIITMQPGAVFDWAGGQLSVDTFFGNLPNHGGILAARDGSNSILVTGEYSQGPIGALAISIDGPAASHRYDSLTVGNTAFLGGELHVELGQGFVPGGDEVYTIIDALNMGLGDLTNVRNGERLYVHENLGSFLVHYGAESLFDPSQVVLTDFALGPPGDFDQDGDVDGRDFLAWQRGNSPNSLSAGDLADWQANYGTGSLSVSRLPPSVLSISVPEPASGIACYLLLMHLLSPRRLKPNLRHHR